MKHTPEDDIDILQLSVINFSYEATFAHPNPAQLQMAPPTLVAFLTLL